MSSLGLIVYLRTAPRSTAIAIVKNRILIDIYNNYTSFIQPNVINNPQIIRKIHLIAPTQSNPTKLANNLLKSKQNPLINPQQQSRITLPIQ